MADNLQATFTEVLEVQVATQKFESGLQELKRLYDQFIQEVGDGAEGVVGTSAFVGIREELKSMREEADAFNKDFITEFSKLSSVVVDALDRIDQTEQASSKNRRQRAKEDAEQQIRYSKEVTDTISQNLKELETRERSRQERGDPSLLGGVHPAQKSAQEIEAEQTKLAADADKEYNAALQKTIELQNRLARTSGFVDLANQIKETKRQLDEVLARINQLKQSGTVSTNGTGKIDTAAQKEYNELLQQQIGLTSSLESASNKFKNTNKSLFEQFGDEVGGAVVGLLKFYIVWNSLTLAVQAATKVFELPFLALKLGLDYTRGLEESTNSLALTLFANVKYSESLKQNFSDARAVAADLAKEVEKISAKNGLDPQKLLDTFKALSEGGAPQLTNTARQVLSLATSFQIMLTNMGSGALATQISLEEVAKLLKGQIGEGGNKFLQVLGLGRGEWQAMVERAKTHKDIVEQLAPKMEAYNEAIKAGTESQQRLLNQVQLLGRSIFGDATKNIFDKVSQSLIYLNDLVEKNQTKITYWLTVFYDHALKVAESLGQMVYWFFQLPIGSAILQSMGKDMIIFSTNCEIAALAVTSLFKAIKAGRDRDVAGVEKIFDDYKKQLDELRKTATDQLAVLSGQKKIEEVKPTGPSPLDKQFKPGKNNPDDRSGLEVLKSQLERDRKAIELEVEKILEKYDALRQGVQRSVADNILSKQDEAAAFRKFADDEIDALEKQRVALIAKTRAAAAAVAQDNADVNQRRAATIRLAGEIDDINKRFDKTEATIRKGVASANRDAVKENAETRLVVVKGVNERLVQEIQAANAEINQAYSSGLLTDRERFEALAATAEQAHDRRVKALQDELAQYIAATPRRQEVIEKLKLEDQRYTEEVELQSRQRQAIIEQEEQKRTQHEAQMRAIALDRKGLETEIAALLTPPQGFSTQQDAVLKARQREIDQLEAEKLKLLEVAAAKNKESEETRKLTEEVEQLNVQRLAAFRDRLANVANTASNPASGRTLEQNIIQQELRNAQSNQGAAERRLSNFDNVNQFVDVANSPILQAIRDGLVKDVNAARKAVDQFGQMLSDATPTLGKSFRDLADRIFGADAVQNFLDAETSTQKLAAGANLAANALASIGAIVDTFKQGQQKGGTLGGIGAVASSLSGVLSEIPVVGKFIPAIGGVLSFIGGLFTSAAKRIAEDVKKSFQTTIDNYQQGNATLIQTLNALEAQRNDAIVRLSGKKGGKDQLDQILPEFDKEIQSLKKTQQDIFQSFDDAVDTLRLHSDTLAQVQKQWQDINKQVRDYIGAGGSAAKAAEFLQLSLAKIQEQAAEELAQGERDALQDAVQLNDLLKQRLQLVDDFNQKEFDLINADAIERRQAGSVTRGKELEALRKQHQDELDNLDAQITLTQTKVNKEREIFNIATDIAALKKRQNELDLEALDQQIQKWRDLRDIANGTVGFNLLGQSGEVTQNFYANINITGSGADAGTQAADSFVAEYRRQMRQRT